MGLSKHRHESQHNHVLTYPFFHFSAQELSQEIKSFITGVDPAHGRKLSVREHARCAVRLLRSVPPCRGAVLEHLRGVYDEHVSSFLHNLEMEGNASTGVTSNLEDETREKLALNRLLIKQRLNIQLINITISFANIY